MKNDNHGRTIEEIRKAGLHTLSDSLGPVGMVRFLQQYETGQGDYSKERHRWLDKMSVGEIANKIARQKKSE